VDLFDVMTQSAMPRRWRRIGEARAVMGSGIDDARSGPVCGEAVIPPLAALVVPDWWSPCGHPGRPDFQTQNQH